jgi:hypothetical protein
VFAVFWAMSSAAMLLFFTVAGWRLNSEIRRSQPLAVGDQHVMLSDHLGPAVLGFIRPRIVLPRWLAEQNSVL